MIYANYCLTPRYDADGTYDIKMEYDQAGNTTVNYDGYKYFYAYENRLIEVNLIKQ